jgi:predicted nucleic acid-binding protein
MVAEAVARGRSPTVGDAQIAAVARRHRMAVAWRDIRAFEALDVAVIDPWTGA